MAQSATDVTLLAQADLVFLAADLLRRPDEGDTAPWADAMGALPELLRAAGIAHNRALLGSLREALLAAMVAEHEPWREEYHRLFEGLLLCPPNQTAYVRRDKGAIIGDACGFYLAFGFRPRDDAGEKPDHIVSQLEFVALLLAMAYNAPDEERRRLVADALRDFADSHLGEWLPSFAGRLASVTQMGLYSAVARALRELWEALAEHHGLRADPSTAGAPEPEPDEPYECGLAPSPAAPVQVNFRGCAV